MNAYSDTLIWQPGQPVWYRLDSFLVQTSTKQVPDSSYASPVGPTSSEVRHFFHSTKTPMLKGNAAEDRRPAENDWLYGSFALILIMIVILRLLYASEVTRLLRSMIFPGKPGTDSRVFEFRFNLFTVLFMLIYSLSLGLLFLPAMELFPKFSLQFSETHLKTIIFFGTSAAAGLMIFLKIMLVRAAGAVFSTKDSALLYQDHMLISMFSTATLIIPLLVVNAFSSSIVFLVIALFFLAFFSFIRLVRSISISFSTSGYSLFHFLLYFCTLEILPLLILGKGIFLWLK
jgi:hypothetical protein